MKMTPLVSIIIPVYNVEQYLEECMHSILNQTYTNLDIVLVNDGSKDNSPQMCMSYAKADKRVTVIHKTNGGLISAWIAGVEKARGEYLCFVDSDDWVELNMIEELVKQTSGHEKEIICSNYVMEKIEKKQSIPMKQSMKPGVYVRKELETGLFLELLGKEERRIHASRCMKLISVKLIKDNIRYTNQKVTMGEDFNIMYPALLDADRIVIMEEGYYYHYRLVDSSMAHKYNPKLHEKIRLLYEALRKVIEEKITGPKEQKLFLEGLKKEYIFLMFLVLKNELRSSDSQFKGKIQNIVSQEKADLKLQNTEVEVTSKANVLLYKIWNKPSNFWIMLGRIAIKIFDRL